MDATVFDGSDARGDVEMSAEADLDSGPDSDSDSGSDSDSEAGADTAASCAAYCDCMRVSCPAIEAGSCDDRCGAFTSEQLKCFAYFCLQAARYPELSPHFCDHATGRLGTVECPK
jgi:hypothetical protein